MKQFFKFTLATIVGILLSAILLFLIIISIAAASLSKSEKEFAIKDNSVLKISLSGSISEQSEDNPFDFNIPGLPINTKSDRQGLDDLLQAIKKAATTEQIKGIYIESGTLEAGLVTSEEIREALLEFKKSGKYIVAYGDTYDQRNYFICSVADKVFINPIGLLNWSGLSATPMFYTGALNKLGIGVEIFKVGTFKSAVEPYFRTDMSPESRLQTTTYLNGIWNHLLLKISESRAVTPAELNRLADQNMLFIQPVEFVHHKLVDSLIYKSDVKKYLASLQGVENPEDLPYVSVGELLRSPTKDAQYIKDKVALLYAEGNISQNGTEGITSENLIKEIEKIKSNDQVKAVVFRVNSRGGDAFASEQIWKAISDLDSIKPVVVSMGDYAASGGYYISCNARKIVVSPNTLTGSIGIFGMYINVDKLSNKLGLTTDVVKTNQLSDLGDIFRPMTALEKQKIQQYVNNGYELFVSRCASGRKMKVDDIKAIAEGRVWTGEKAVELGLADELGGIDRAVKLAAELGNLTTYEMVYFPEKQNFVTRLMKELTDNVQLKWATSFMGEEFKPFLAYKKSGIQTGILALMDEIDIH